MNRKHVLLASVLILAPATYSQDYRLLVQEMLGKVSADSMMQTIQKLQAFPTRSTFSPYHDSAAAYLLARINRMGVAAESDWLDCDGQYFISIGQVSENTFCVGDFCMYRSTDGGRNWTNQGNPANDRMNGIHFASGGVGFAVGMFGDIMKSADAGKTWVTQSSGSTASLYDVKCLNERTIVAVGTQGVILRTSDGGSSWSKVVSGVTVSLNEVDVVDSLSLWVAGNSGVVLRSGDGGLNWTRVTVNSTASFYGIDMLDNRTGWVVGGGSAALYTTNGGVNWVRTVNPYGVGVSLQGVLLRDSARAFVVHGNGVVATTDAGITWKSVLTLDTATAVKIKANGSQGLIVCGYQGIVYTSSDNGASWSRSTICERSRNIVGKIVGKRSPEKECIIMGHYDSYANPDVLLRAPGANDNASAVSAVIEAARIMKAYEFENTVVFLALTNEESGGDGSDHYASTAKSQNRVILGAVNGDMIGLAASGSRNMLRVGYYQSQNKLVDSALVFNARYDLGLMLTTLSTGGSDHALFTKYGYDAIDILEYASDPLYHTPFDTAGRLSAAALSSAAKLMLATVAELARPLGRVTNVLAQEAVPVAYSLEQNYPNPFNPGTTISFSLPKAEIVSLKIFNTLGQEIASLVNERKEPGSYRVEWVANAPSGIYFYRLQAGGFLETRKMVLLK